MKLKKAFRWLDENFEMFFIALSVVWMTVIMFIQVVCRNFFHYAIPWAEESARYIYVWCGCLGISYATKTNTHLRMDILPTFVKPLQKPLKVFCDVLVFVFCLGLIPAGMTAITKIYASGQTSVALHMPMWLLYTGLELSLILTLFRTFENYIKIYLDWKKSKTAAAEKEGNS